MRFEASREEAKAAIARDWMAGRKDGKDIIVLAHTRADVRDLNEAIRRARAAAGELGEAAAFQTGQGKREFAAGDRVVFLKNDRELGVKNGTLGRVEEAAAGRLGVVLDNGERRTVEAHAYAAVDHGYAVTIHKAQGATVDRAFVLASGGMDRHLTYVAMTRHREQVTLYAGRDDFENHGAMAWRLARKRTNETTLDFAERRGIDTLRDWIGNGRALLNRAQARFEQAIDRMGERLGLGGRNLRQELQERRQQAAEPAARWKAAVEAEAKDVRAKAQRIAAKAEKRKAALTKNLDEIERAAPAKPRGLSALFFGAKARYEGRYPSGRRSGTGWYGRLTACASARPRSVNSPRSPSLATGAGARRWPGGKRLGGIPSLPRRSGPGRSSKSRNGRRRSARSSRRSVSANGAARDAKQDFLTSPTVGLLLLWSLAALPAHDQSPVQADSGRSGP